MARRQMTQVWNGLHAAVGRVAGAAGRSRVALAVVSAIVAAGVAVAVLAIAGSSPGNRTPASAPGPATRAARAPGPRRCLYPDTSS
jgi:hypothetical protein